MKRLIRSRKAWAFLAVAAAAVLAIGILAVKSGVLGTRIESLEAVRPRKTVALVLKALDSEHWIQVKKGAEEAARAYGVDLILRAADEERNFKMQYRMVEDLLEEDIDALCIAPSDSEGILPLVRQASSLGIPVYTIDTDASGGAGINAFIGTDNYKAGQMAGERMKTVLGGEGTIMVVTGIMAQQVHKERLEGFSDALAGSGLEIGLVVQANSDPDLAYSHTKLYLERGRTIDGIFATNALMTVGILEALRQTELIEDITVIGFDHQKELIFAIEEGHLDSTVSQDPYRMGYLAVETFIKQSRGEAVPAYIETQSSIITLETLQANESGE